jgi:hypothetical protein
VARDSFLRIKIFGGISDLLRPRCYADTANLKKGLEPGEEF